MNVVLIVGAGSTLSEAAGKPVKARPPLDRGFFAAAKAAKAPEYNRITSYMQETYSVDPTNPGDDSLEGVLAVIYSDIYNPAAVQPKAVQAFRDLLRLINRRIADTTNRVAPSRKKNLYRLIRRLISWGCSPSDISILTFNQDLHIERTLHALSQTASLQKHLPLFSFPHFYRLPKFSVSGTPSSVARFDTGSPENVGIEVLKLHGSLNWFSKHISSEPTPQTLLNPNRELWITRRRSVPTNMTFKAARIMYTFPVVIPPVIHKASILHRDMAAVWTRAREVLSEADTVIVFGYSCPVADQESASLMQRGLRQSEALSDLIVIDPSPATFGRWVELSARDALIYYRNAKAFLSAA